MKRIIKSIEDKYLLSSLDFVEEVFTLWRDEKEGKLVRALVEEIRRKEFYIPELELIMVDENDLILGYAMFSRFHLEGKYSNELLMLTPVGVRKEYQRQHISKDLIEYGFKKAKSMGFSCVIVEGDPKNYNPRGFVTSSDHGIVPKDSSHLPNIACLMVKELKENALKNIHGQVDYSFYECLR